MKKLWKAAATHHDTEVTLDQLNVAFAAMNKVNEGKIDSLEIDKAKDKFSRRNNELPDVLFERPASLLIPYRKKRTNS